MGLDITTLLIGTLSFFLTTASCLEPSENSTPTTTSKTTASTIVTATTSQTTTTPTTPPCIMADEACSTSNGQFIKSVTNITSEEECRQVCGGDPSCSHLTHFPDSAFPFSNVCMIFSSCSIRHNCQGCVTADQGCAEVCGDNVVGQIGDNLIETVADVGKMEDCWQICKDTQDCLYFTHFNADNTLYPSLCLLLKELNGPFKTCTNCSTGAVDCSSKQLSVCGLLEEDRDGNQVEQKQLFTSTVKTASLRQIRVGHCRPADLTIVSSDRSSCTDDGLLYIQSGKPTFSDLEHLCLSILLLLSVT